MATIDVPHTAGDDLALEAALALAVRQVQAKAKTNPANAAAIARTCVVAWRKAVHVAAALGLKVEALQARATWCPTASAWGAGTHTIVRLSPYGWRISRGGPPTGEGAYGIVTVQICEQAIPLALSAPRALPAPRAP